MRRRTYWRWEVVSAINYWHQIGSRVEGGTMADAVLMLHGYSADQADDMLEDAADEGLIEYGVSPRTGWLTNKGRALLHSENRSHSDYPVAAS